MKTKVTNAAQQLKDAAVDMVVYTCTYAPSSKVLVTTQLQVKNYLELHNAPYRHSNCRHKSIKTATSSTYITSQTAIASITKACDSLFRSQRL